MIYEYRCNRCAKTEEKIIRASEIDKAGNYPCPCGGIMEKTFAPNGVTFALPRSFNTRRFERPKKRLWDDYKERTG